MPDVNPLLVALIQEAFDTKDPNSGVAYYAGVGAKLFAPTGHCLAVNTDDVPMICFKIAKEVSTKEGLECMKAFVSAKEYGIPVLNICNPGVGTVYQVYRYVVSTTSVIAAIAASNATSNYITSRYGNQTVILKGVQYVGYASNRITYYLRDAPRKYAWETCKCIVNYCRKGGRGNPGGNGGNAFIPTQLIRGNQIIYLFISYLIIILIVKIYSFSKTSKFKRIKRSLKNSFNKIKNVIRFNFS